MLSFQWAVSGLLSYQAEFNKNRAFSTSPFSREDQLLIFTVKYLIKVCSCSISCALLFPLEFWLCQQPGDNFTKVAQFLFVGKPWAVSYCTSCWVPAPGCSVLPGKSCHRKRIDFWKRSYMLLARLESYSVTVFWEMRLSNVEKAALKGLHICRTTELPCNVQKNDVLSY